jgi:hypothetical protein
MATPDHGLSSAGEGRILQALCTYGWSRRALHVCAGVVPIAGEDA